MLHMVTRLAVAAAIALAVAGCTTDATGAGSSQAAGRPVGSSSPPATAPPKHHKHHRVPAVHAGPGWTVRRARSVLPHLRVHAAGSMRGYDRDRFGPAWEDVDGDGCDTRNDILNRDLTARAWDDAAHCEVRRGVLRDPYRGRLIHFRRGVETSLAVQIDHMVALADAWRTGAARWRAGRRLAYCRRTVGSAASTSPTR